MWRPHDRISDLIGRNRREFASLCVCPPCEATRRRLSTHKLEREFSPRTKSAGILTLDFRVFRTGRNKFVV